jgi:hypothetical protein
MRLNKKKGERKILETCILDLYENGTREKNQYTNDK